MYQGKIPNRSRGRPLDFAQLCPAPAAHARLSRVLNTEASIFYSEALLEPTRTLLNLIGPDERDKCEATRRASQAHARQTRL